MGSGLVKSDFLPDQDWVDGAVALEKLVGHSKSYRAALSRNHQDIPHDPSGYDLTNLGLPTAVEKPSADFAHRLGLSQHQAFQMFGDEGTKLTQELEEYYKKEHSAMESDDAAKYVEEEIEKYGGRDKVKHAVERMDRLFTTMKNRGLMDDDEISDFKDFTFTNAASIKGFEKVMNLIDSISNGATVNAHGNGSPSGNKYNGLPVDAIIKEIVTQRHQAKYAPDHDVIYKTLDTIKSECCWQWSPRKATTETPSPRIKASKKREGT
jgi:hypothetical protein